MPNRPNILFLFPDQWRWDWLGCHDGTSTPYGNAPVSTPHIDALAARGVRYTQCRTNSPVCSPARACVATGRRYEHCGVRHNKDITASDPPTLFKLLRDAGYHTMTCGKSDLFKPDRSPNPTGYLPVMDELGFSDGIDHRGKFDAMSIAREGGVETYTQMLANRDLLETHLNHRYRDSGATPLPTDAYTDDFAGQNALKLLERAPADKPWMLWLNFPGPHDPFDPPAEALEPYENVDFSPPVGVDDPSTLRRDVMQDRRCYAAECTHLDDWIGRLIAHLEATGQLDNTLIVFTSDHGEMIGDHGKWGKSVPHEGSMHVPLILAGAGIEPGDDRDQLVELIDVSATLLDAAGVDRPSHWEARSLLGNTDPPREVSVSSLGKWKSIFDGRYKLILREDKDAELYDLAADPAELNDLAEQSPEIVEQLTQRFRDEIGSADR